MSLIQCNCNCLYEKEGYCKLDKASVVTASDSKGGCLHFRERNIGTKLNASGTQDSPQEYR